MNTQKRLFSLAKLFEALFFIFIVSILLSASSLSVKAQTDTQRNPYEKLIAGDNVEPPLSNYKGVTLGMSAADSRAKLGDPAVKSDVQDFYIISDNETVQVFYDKDLRVNAISISFDGDKAPTSQKLLGLDAVKKEDGSFYLIVEYPKAGFWISYSKSAGPVPVVTVTLRKI